MSWEYTEKFQDVTVGKLRQSFVTRQDFPKKIPEHFVERYHAGQFRSIPYRDQLTVIRLGDGGIVGYRVPARLVSKNLEHVKGLEDWTKEFGGSLPKTNDTKRGVSCVRRYAYWVKYNKGGQLKLSGDYYRDGNIAEKFMKSSALLWGRAKDWFPQHYLSRIYRDLSEYNLDVGQKRLCGLWPGCAVNVAVYGQSVETKPHRDLLGFFHGMSCLCAFGDFTGGSLILWELQAVLELRSGDLFYFTDHLLNHSNEAANGLRNSVVAFLEDKTWKWMQKTYGFTDRRMQRVLTLRKKYKEARKLNPK